MEDSLAMFFTGYSHSASAILESQDKKSKEKDNNMIQNLHFVKELAYDSAIALINGDIKHYADLMHIHWQAKRSRSNDMSNPQIDEWYEYGLMHGALGGKLIGAGGGGFLLFVCEDKARLREAMSKIGLQEVRFRFVKEGTQVMVR